MAKDFTTRPQDAPEPVVKHLVSTLGLNVSWAYKLKAVMKPGQQNGSWDFRLYNETDVRAKNLKIKDYASFDAFPQMSLYEGSFNPKTQSVELTKK